MRSPGPPSYAALGDTAAYEHRAVTFDRRVPRNAPLSYCDAARSWCVLCGNRRSDCPGFDKNSAHPKYEPLAFLPAATDDATVMDFIEKTGGGLASSPRADYFKTLKALQRRSSDSRSGGRGGGNGDGGGWRGSGGSRAPSGGFHRGVGGSRGSGWGARSGGGGRHDSGGDRPGSSGGRFSSGGDRFGSERYGSSGPSNGFPTDGGEGRSGVDGRGDGGRRGRWDRSD